MSLAKQRGFSPVLNKDGTFYTGYEHNINESKQSIIDGPHESQQLTLRYDGIRRGRSAANFKFTGWDDGRLYIFSMKSFEMLFKSLVSGAVIANGDLITADFQQIKQGANYFIAPVME